MFGCCHICFPKRCCDGKQALLVLLAGGVCKFDHNYVSNVRGKLLVAISLEDAWGIYRIRNLCPPDKLFLNQMDINLCPPDKLSVDQMDINFCPPNQLALNQMDINLCPEKLVLDQKDINLCHSNNISLDQMDINLCPNQLFDYSIKWT